MQNPNPLPHERIRSLVESYWQGRAIAVVTELRVPDLLAEGPLPVDEIASRTGTNTQMIFRLLRALESIGVFTQVSPEVFANTAMSDCLRNDVPGSQRPMVMHNLSKGNGPFEAWQELEYALRSGAPAFNKIYGQDFWKYLLTNPQANEAMNRAMGSFSVAMTPVITAAYDWTQLPVIADIGGGIGALLTSILDASASSKGILFDQPHLGPEAIPHDRMDVVGGDFFESVPANADAYLLRWILHDWSDAEAGEILGVLRRQMKPSARLVVIELLVPEDSAFHFSKWTDLQMMVLISGRERTEREFRTLLTTAGFDVEEVIATASPLSLIVAKPASDAR